MLDIQDISKTFNAGTVNEKTALNHLSLHLNEGDFVTVIGGNGAGHHAECRGWRLVGGYRQDHD